ncbi:hypothetical protein [Gordonia sp. NPDC003376]
MLPRAAIVQVTKESDFFDALAQFVPANGYGLVYATLRRDVVVTARTTKDVVAVRISGEKIGELTPAMSGKFLPLIDHLQSRGLTAVCWADLTGSAVAAEVRIDAVKAHEADAGVLDGPPTAAQPLIPELVAQWWAAVRTPPERRERLGMGYAQ